MTATLVYKNSLSTGATDFLSTLDTLLTNPFQSTNFPNPGRGLGWSRIFNSDIGKSTTLTAGINASVTVIPVVATNGSPPFQVPGTILIGTEQISYSSVTDTSFTGCIRGINGTTTATHLNAAAVVSVSDKIYFSVGSGKSERIYLRLTASNDNTYIDRQICQAARISDGYMIEPIGATSQTKISVGSLQFEYWLVANQDFIHIVTLVNSVYYHFYCGIVNRFAPNQNSSIYDSIAPNPTSTTIPSAMPFTIATNTTLFLRIGFDGYGGYDASNISFIIGQNLYIVDQSIGTSTSGNQGVVVLNAIDLIQNTITVTYVSGNNIFSSFSLVGIDPQPVALNSGGVVRGSPFFMIDDYVGDIAPQFNAVDEFATGTGLPAENIQSPNIRNVFITYPIRLSNAQEVRGTLYGMIDTPPGSPGAQDLFKTFDQLYKFINFPDGNDHTIAIGSII